ncbi:MAG: MarR family transcriptional regulator [Chloroflexota bacterium]
MPTTKPPPFDRQKREQWLAFVQTLSPAADPRTIRLIGLLHRTGHALARVGETSLSAAGLSYAQYRLLMSLLFCEQFEGQAALNPSEISERQGISRNTASALISKLEAEGLIERELDQADRRKFIIRLTPAGRELVRDHASQHFHTIHQCFHVLTPEEQETMSQLLERLNESSALQRR